MLLHNKQQNKTEEIKMILTMKIIRTKYIPFKGFRVCVYNTGTSYKVSGSETWVNTEIEITTNGKSRLCRSVRRDGEGQIHREFSDKFIVELGCYVEFVACPNRSVFGGTEQIDIVWMINEVIQVKG